MNTKELKAIERRLEWSGDDRDPYFTTSQRAYIIRIIREELDTRAPVAGLTEEDINEMCDDLRVAADEIGEHEDYVYNSCVEDVREYLLAALSKKANE